MTHEENKIYQLHETESVHSIYFVKSSFCFGQKIIRGPYTEIFVSSKKYSCHSGHQQATSSQRFLSAGWRERKVTC